MRTDLSGALLKRASFSSAGVMAAQISNALGGIIIARGVGATQFGTYAALWAAVAVATSLGQIGVTEGLRRDASRFPAALPALLGNAIVVELTIGLAALSLMYVLSVRSSVNPESWTLFLPLAVAGLCGVFIEPVFAGMEVTGRQKTVALIQFGRGVAFLAGVVILAFGGAGLDAFVWYQGLLAVIIVLTVCMGPLRSIGVSMDLTIIRSQVTTSFVFGLSGALYTLYSNLPILLLSYFGTQQQVGYFAVAMRVVGLLFMVGAAASNRAFIPALFGLYKSDLLRFREVSNLMQRFFTQLGVLVGAVLYASADVIVLILLGKEYRPAVPLLRALSIAVALSYFALGPGAALTTADRMWTKVSFQAGVTILSAVAGSLVIMYYGAIAASYTLVGTWAAIVFLYFTYSHFYKLTTCGIPTGMLARMLAFSVFGVAVTLVLPTEWVARLSLIALGSICVLYPWFLEIWRNRAVVRYVEADE